MSEYPPEVIDYVCDPRTGIARRLKFLPTIAEVASECDIRVGIQKTVAALYLKATRMRSILADPDATPRDKATAQSWLDNVKGEY